MLVYEGIKSGFINDVDLGIIADKIRNKYIEKIKRRPSAPEFNSWKNSMQYMRGVLSDNEIPENTGIAIEYNIPPTGCRIDFMMSGFNKNKSNVVIIYNFSELIRMYNVAIEGYFTYDKFNAKAINKLSNILSMAKYFDGNKNLTLICIEKTDVNEDVKTLITSEFMPLFKVIYDMNEVNSYKNED